FWTRLVRNTGMGIEVNASGFIEGSGEFDEQSEECSALVLGQRLQPEFLDAIDHATDAVNCNKSGPRDRDHVATPVDVVGLPAYESGRHEVVDRSDDVAGVD